MPNFSEIKKRLDILESKEDFKTKIHLTMDCDTYEMRVNPGTEIECFYKPNPTGLLIHKDKSLVLIETGPFGSGKSTTMCFKTIQCAVEIPRCKDGIHRSRCTFVRNTAAQLESTTLQTWDSWADDLGDVKVRQSPYYTKTYTFNAQLIKDKKPLGDIRKVEMQIWLLALDNPRDFRKLRSLETTRFYVNEASELPRGLVPWLIGRSTSRFPKIDDCTDKYEYGVVMDTNAPPENHWIPELFDKQSPEGHILYKQPPGLLKDSNGKWYQNPNCDNSENLDSKYYTNMTFGADDEFIKVNCLGEYGMMRTGKPVFPQYSDNIHAVDDISADINHPIIISFDTGLTSPAAVIMQHINGQIRFIKEFVSDAVYLDEMLHNHVMPYLRDNYGGFAKEYVCDPATTFRDMDLFTKCGLLVEKAWTNDIDPRVKSVAVFMNRLISGTPGLIVSKSGCPVLRSGFYGEYCYKKIQVAGDRYRDLPDKSHPISDVQDCAQYGALKFYTDSSINNIDYSGFLNRERY